LHFPSRRRLAIDTDLVRPVTIRITHRVWDWFRFYPFLKFFLKLLPLRNCLNIVFKMINPKLIRSVIQIETKSYLLFFVVLSSSCIVHVYISLRCTYNYIVHFFCIYVRGKSWPSYERKKGSLEIHPMITSNLLISFLII
jgi:hypothetical protein